jgi:hypothetical protein
MFHGTSQDVGITSRPSGARVTIDGGPAGTTPVMVSLKRRSKHTVVISLEGYEPFEFVTERTVSWLVAGNVLLATPIGFIIDVVGGGMYNVNPETITGMLTPSDKQLTQSDDETPTVVLARTGSPGWEKIGQLRRIEAQ